MYERTNVPFAARISEGKYCTCDSCGDIGEVIILLLPLTKYFDGEKLSTEYESYWLCFDCLSKLMSSLENAMEGYDGKCTCAAK